MSIYDFAKQQYFKTFNTGEINTMGAFKVSENGELKYIRSLFYIHGVLTGTEKIRLKICTDSNYSNVLYTSGWSTLLQSNYYGWIRFDFARENLNKTCTYYVYAEIADYTRNADSFYICQAYDYPWPVYDNSEGSFYNHPLAMQIFCYVDND
jgi:hypothetical protein